MKSQDVMVALAILVEGGTRPTYAALASRLGLSSSEAHAAVKRLQQSGLLDERRDLNRGSLLEFLLHGLKYVFPAQLGSPSLGVPTGPSAPSLRKRFAKGETLVWPSPIGTERGVALLPLYRTAPDVALRDAELYELLALVDCLRAGRARERNYAAKQLQKKLAHEDPR